ncbi:Protein YIPF5 [Tetrabaena socialis]|uniref:Protein YIPF5 n=1 Tax=Tetrabaena socialis TaxID=47790 RepID=A0A2J8ABL8_9CHLO|nr:Protein YIPF5 [Tetrabaena socialis]|eukprot:PNH09918.1 Protein YIPF5 [Tetrabaena socialis]
MAEWNVRPQAYGGAAQPGGAGVEWFSGAGAGAGSASGSYGAYGSYAAPSSGYGGFEDEPPLLEELGIDVGAIFVKTRAVLLLRFNSRYLDDLDMGGALIFVFILAGLQLLMGKLHFGVTLGWSVVFSVLLWFLLRQLVGSDGAEAKNLDLYGCCCVVGYSMLPLVLFCAVAILIPRGVVLLLAAAACTVWAALTASRIFARRCPALEELKGVIMYPCLLTYATFALLIVY